LILFAAGLLMQLGVCELRPCDASDVDERALALVEACAVGPHEKPAGRRCLVEAAILWRLESRLAWYPPARGTGCGPLQVIPTRLHNSRIGWTTTPPCAGLRDPLLGLRWGVVVLRLKARWGSWRARARAYNGSRLRDAYARRALVWERRIRGALNDS